MTELFKVPILKTKLRYVGLDGEMTGTTKRGEGPAPEKYQLIQIGMATSVTDIFTSDIGFQVWNSTEQAMAVNHFTPERIRAGPLPGMVDEEACKWLDAKVGPGVRDIHAVGWNVGAFDMPFVNKYLPATGDRFSYRSVDLNSIVYGIIGLEGTDKQYDRVKRAAKGYAETELKKVYPNPAWHDAGFDAAAGLLAFEYLSHRIAGTKGSYTPVVLEPTTGLRTRAYCQRRAGARETTNCKHLRIT